MTLYARTARGTAAMLTNRSDLPRRLRSLLIAIDGRTDSTSFVSNLSSFGDVLSLLESLKGAGYIEEIAQKSLPLRRSLGERKAGPDNTAPTASTGEAPYLEAPRIPPATHTPYLPAEGAPFAVTDSDKSRVASMQLKAAVNLMSDFVTQHLAAQALEIVIELERLSSVESLMQSLASYEQLVKSAGDNSRQHMRELRMVLASL